MAKKLYFLNKLINGTFSGIENLLLRIPDKTSLRPKWMWFEATDRCNSHCIHCNIWAKKPTENPLTPEELERIFQDPVFRDLGYIIISGGEPVLRPDIVDLYLAMHRALPRAGLHLSTNAIAAERVLQVVKELISHGIFMKVGVSVDGIGEKHDIVRRVKGNFEKADWLLKELVKLGEQTHMVSPGIGYTLSDLTMDSFEEVRDYAKKLGVRLGVQWLNVSSFYNNIGKELIDKERSSERMIKIIESLPPEPLNEMWVNWLKGDSIKFRCFAMYTFCVLKCNGEIVPCLSLWDVKAGNVREKTPTEIWNSFEAVAARKCVKNCPGCLNSWGVYWSFLSSFFPSLIYNLKHPKILLEKLTGKFYKRK